LSRSPALQLGYFLGRLEKIIIYIERRPHE
jgi:hypothetical protein